MRTPFYATPFVISTDHHFGDIPVHIGRRFHVVRIMQTPDLFIYLDGILGKDEYWVTCNGKPVNPRLDWALYSCGLVPNIKVHARMRGGSPYEGRKPTTMTGFRKPVTSAVKSATMGRFTNGTMTQMTLTTLPKWGGKSVRTGEWTEFHSKSELAYHFHTANQRLCKKERVERKLREWQSMEGDLPALVSVRNFLMKNLDGDVVSLVEDLTLLIVQLVRSRGITDTTLAFVTFLKLRSSTSVLMGLTEILGVLIADVYGPEFQADDSEYDLLQRVTDFRSFLTNWETLKESTLVKCAVKLFNFAAALGVCAQIGIKLDERTLKECRKETSSVLAGPNFVCALLDMIALLIQRALLYAKTGEWSSFFHGAKSYGQWYDQCMLLKRQHMFIGNLEVLGTNYHSFVKSLTDAIETGKNILKFGSKTGGAETLAVKKLLNEVQLIQASVFTYSAAQQTRRPPFSLLVHGGSSVCKSTFVDMLFQFTGRVYGLPTDDDFKYSRNPSDQFWSGWNSAKWFVHLDDVAYVDPSSNVQDASLMEIIQIVNDVPMVPNQAALEDKGKNPVRAKVVVASTNTKHLNAHAHFSCPLAVQRRLPFVITVEPKAEYAREDAKTMMDPLKLPLITEDWPDFWIISVDKVVPSGTEGRAEFLPVRKFTNVNEFLDWLKDTMEIFQAVQAKAAVGSAAMAGFKLCGQCNRVACMCAQLQALEYEYPLPLGTKFGESFHKIIEEGDAMWTYDWEYCPNKASGTNYVITTTKYVGNVRERRFTTQVKVSEECRKPEVQSEEVAMATILSEIVARQAQLTGTLFSQIAAKVVTTGLGWYVKYNTFRYFTNSMMEWKVCRKLAGLALRLHTRPQRPFYEFCGATARNVYLSRRWRKVLKGLAIASATAVGMYGAVSLYRRLTPVEKEQQGLRLSVPDALFPKTEKENVWKRDSYETSSFDKTPLNVSYASLPRDQLMALVHRNVCRIRVSNGVRVREGNAFCVGGHLWVTNTHTFFPEGDLQVKLEVQALVLGASPNIEFKMRQHEIYHTSGSDLSWFMVYGWEVKRDLRQLIRKPSLMGEYRAAYTGYNKQRAPQENVVKAVKLGEVQGPSSDHKLIAWHGISQDLTTVGDCGMPLVTHKPVAAILGIHALGSATSEVWAVAIDSDMVDAAVAHFDRPMIQCSTPEISAPSAVKTLGELRQYSPVRWLEEGSAHVFGSFQGFAPTGRSKVTSTLLGDVIKEERGWVVDAHKPRLNDWRPWRLALLDITQQKYGSIDSVKLRICARGYVTDVLIALKPEHLKMMQPLSDTATVNGIDGVKFIDKMNFKSSMGEPYCKSKKFFLEGSIGEKKFVAEVSARIQRIEDAYSRGERVCPVFSGQLKDEARPLAKVEAGKVRVFTGAPADWSFVVRKYLLPFVKVMQENPFVFESSPGCATQTLEWERYYDFLTHFGPDRIIAGDYGKFDKKMEALIILEAFWIIAEILKAAGWTDDELLMVHCIGEDTAYSYANFNGDLIMFFGSNPSGHPLTVIVNCIVNILYMRYCYLTLCPGDASDLDKVRTFKENVHLLTYGDDNTMGVSRSASWFNHTAVQRVLATIGVEYTMADKHSESVPFIHIRDVAYLKRTWRWVEEIGAVVCQLEEASIQKMLTVCIPSDTESPENHMASVIVSAVNEWFWYGRQRFESERAWLWQLAVNHDIHHEVKAKGFPTWEQLYDRFWKSSEGMITNRSQGCVVEHPRTVVPN